MSDRDYPQVRVSTDTKPKIKAVAEEYRMSFGRAIDAAFDLWRIAPDHLRVKAIRGVDAKQSQRRSRRLAS